MSKLIALNKTSDIPKSYRNTPIGQLVEYHNLNKPFEKYAQAQLLVGMCMDNRKHLHIPDNFAFIIRAGGANLRHSEFKVSYAIAVGGVSHIALIGHNHCGMVGLENRKDIFIKGMIKHAGWKKKAAEEYFMDVSAFHEIGNEIEFVLSEVKRLRVRFPKVKIAPMLYKVEENRLYLLKEK